MPSPTPLRNVTRLHVNIGPDTLAALNDVTDREHVDTAEALRRLVELGHGMYRAVHDGKCAYSPAMCSTGPCATARTCWYRDETQNIAKEVR